MIWPGTIAVSIVSVERADFVALERKHGIFCNDAGQFLRLNP